MDTDPPKANQETRNRTWQKVETRKTKKKENKKKEKEYGWTRLRTRRTRPCAVSSRQRGRTTQISLIRSRKSQHCKKWTLQCPEWDVMQNVANACDAAMPRKGNPHTPVHWWSDKILQLRADWRKIRRLSQWAKGKPTFPALEKTFKLARSKLTKAKRWRSVGKTV